MCVLFFLTSTSWGAIPTACFVCCTCALKYNNNNNNSNNNNNNNVYHVIQWYFHLYHKTRSYSYLAVLLWLYCWRTMPQLSAIALSSQLALSGTHVHLAYYYRIQTLSHSINIYIYSQLTLSGNRTEPRNLQDMNCALLRATSVASRLRDQDKDLILHLSTTLKINNACTQISSVHNDCTYVVRSLTNVPDVYTYLE